jgi:hypothetical protein
MAAANHEILGALRANDDGGASEPSRRTFLTGAAVMYIWPGMTLWLPEFLYGK